MDRLIGGRTGWNALGYATADPGVLQVVGEDDAQMQKDTYVYACKACKDHVNNALGVAQQANPDAAEFITSPPKGRNRGTYSDEALIHSPEFKRLKAVATGEEEGSMRHLPFPASPKVQTTFKVLWFFFSLDAVTD